MRDCQKKNKDVLIQFDNEEAAVAHLEEINYMEYQWYINIDKGNSDGTMEEIVAWQPLPEPYKEE